MWFVCAGQRKAKMSTAGWHTYYVRLAFRDDPPEDNATEQNDTLIRKHVVNGAMIKAFTGDAPVTSVSLVVENGEPSLIVDKGTTQDKETTSMRDVPNPLEHIQKLVLGAKENVLLILYVDAHGVGSERMKDQREKLVDGAVEYYKGTNGEWQFLTNKAINEFVRVVIDAKDDNSVLYLRETCFSGDGGVGQISMSVVDVAESPRGVFRGAFSIAEDDLAYSQVYTGKLPRLLYFGTAVRQQRSFNYLDDELRGTELEQYLESSEGEATGLFPMALVHFWPDFAFEVKEKGSQPSRKLVHDWVSWTRKVNAFLRGLPAQVKVKSTHVPQIVFEGPSTASESSMPYLTVTKVDEDVVTTDAPWFTPVGNGAHFVFFEEYTFQASSAKAHDAMDTERVAGKGKQKANDMDLDELAQTSVSELASSEDAHDAMDTERVDGKGKQKANHMDLEEMVQESVSEPKVHGHSLENKLVPGFHATVMEEQNNEWLHLKLHGAKESCRVGMRAVEVGQILAVLGDTVGGDSLWAQVKDIVSKAPKPDSLPSVTPRWPEEGGDKYRLELVGCTPEDEAMLQFGGLSVPENLTLNTPPNVHYPMETLPWNVGKMLHYYRILQMKCPREAQCALDVIGFGAATSSDSAAEQQTLVPEWTFQIRNNSKGPVSVAVLRMDCGFNVRWQSHAYTMLDGVGDDGAQGCTVVTYRDSKTSFAKHQTEYVRLFAFPANRLPSPLDAFEQQGLMVTLKKELCEGAPKPVTGSRRGDGGWTYWTTLLALPHKGSLLGGQGDVAEEI